MAKIKTFDLSALGLVPGEHTVSVVGRSSNPEYNVTSDPISYNYIDPFVGTWVFNDKLSVVTGTSDGYIALTHTYDIFMDFTVNGVQYKHLYVTDQYNHSTSSYDSIMYMTFNEEEKAGGLSGQDAYRTTDGGWISPEYKTITITKAPYKYYDGTGSYFDITYENGWYMAFKTWLTANATKLSENDSKLINFTLDGTTYQAEEGMTWQQWVDSEYNTGGYIADVGGTIMRNGQHVSTSDDVGAVGHDDVIVSGKAYTFLSIGGGGAN